MVRIEEFKFGELTVDGKTYYSDMVVWWDGTLEYRVKEHLFSLEDLNSILEKRPEVIVVGRGDSDCIKVDPKAAEACRIEGIEFYSDPTPKAIEFFNGLVLQGKKAAGYFHVTN